MKSQQLEQKQTRTLQFDPISSQMDLWKCLSFMRETGVDALPVCDGEVVVGLIQAEDVIRALRGEVNVVSRSLVRDVMKSTVYCCFEDQDHEQIAEDMAASGVRHALVLDHDGNLVGMISLGDPEEWPEKNAWVC